MNVCQMSNQSHFRWRRTFIKWEGRTTSTSLNSSHVCIKFAGNASAAVWGNTTCSWCSSFLSIKLLPYIREISYVSWNPFRCGGKVMIFCHRQSTFYWKEECCIIQDRFSIFNLWRFIRKTFYIEISRNNCLLILINPY